MDLRPCCEQQFELIQRCCVPSHQYLTKQQQLSKGLAIGLRSTGRQIGDTVFAHLLLVNLHAEYKIILFACKAVSPALLNSFINQLFSQSIKLPKIQDFFFFLKVHIVFPSASRNRKLLKENYLKISYNH